MILGLSVSACARLRCRVGVRGLDTDCWGSDRPAVATKNFRILTLEYMTQMIRQPYYCARILLEISQVSLSLS